MSPFTGQYSGQVLSEYIDKALQRACYVRLEDGTYFGDIPGFAGLWANAATEEECQKELRETLEGWIELHMADRMPLPNTD